MHHRLLPTLLLTGCATVFLQEDGFRKRIDRECTDEDDCGRLWEEAKERVRKCAPNTIGKVKCEDAEADLEVVTRRVNQLAAERRAKAPVYRPEPTEADRQQKLRQLQADDDYEARKKSHETEQRRRRLEQEALDAEKKAMAEWRSTEASACAANWTHERCLQPPAGAGTDEVRLCKLGCEQRAKDAATQAHNVAMMACAQAYVAKQGKGGARCDLTVPDGADATYRTVPVECAKRCTEIGQAQLDQLAAERARKNPPAAPAGGGSGGDRVRCCDGTLSPTCTYGRPSLRGCCSHHGGVC